MSTSIKQSEIPDVNEIQRLANAFFKALPGNTPELEPTVANRELQHYQGVDDIYQPLSNIQDPHFKNGEIPSSATGGGIIPTLSSLDNQKAALPEHPVLPILPNLYQYPEPFSGLGSSPYSTAHSNFIEKWKQYNGQDTNHFPLSATTNLDKALYEKPAILKEAPQKQIQDFFSNPSDAFYFLSENQGLHPFNESANQHFSPLSARTTANAFSFDADLIKKDFPILKETVNGKQLIWLDNAATTQKPQSVIDRIAWFYQHENSNIHRAAHELAARATDAYEDARKKVQAFINAASVNEIVFVRGATEAINLVAKSWGAQYLSSGDEIIVSNLEHHANIVPWQQLAQEKKLVLKVIPVDDDGQILLDEYAKLLTPRTKLVSCTQVSNALGTVTPAKQIVALAHQAGAKVLVDGAQSVSHMAVDVQSLNCDWFVFSGHKVFGPTGIGVLYGKEDLLNATQPWQGGGNMIADVTFERTQYHNAPGRFEAGTGNIADAVGLGAAIDYVNKIGINLINQYEHYLLEYATGLIRNVPGLRIIGTAKEKASVLSFVLDGYKTEEVGYALNLEGIAVRSGHHCAQPILRRFGLEATVRPSFAFYNTCSDVDLLIQTLYRLRDQRPIGK